MESFGLRLWGAIIGLFFVVAWNVPNLLSVEDTWWPSKRKLNYGLDIQGGLHLVMGVDVAGVMSEGTRRMIPALEADFTREGITGVQVQVRNGEQGELSLEFPAGQKTKVEKVMQDRYSTMLQKMQDGETTEVYRYLEAYSLDYRTKVIQQAIETIRNRIDEFGVAEPSIAAQGADRILVQLPGMADAEKAKSLINTAAKLDFMLVENRSPEELMGLIDTVEKAGKYDFKSLKYTDYITKLNEDLKGKLPKTPWCFLRRHRTWKIWIRGECRFWCARIPAWGEVRWLTLTSPSGSSVSLWWLCALIPLVRRSFVFSQGLTRVV